MFCVYILNSLVDSDRMYVGFAHNIENRLKEHNAGECFYTKAYMLWKLVTYVWFNEKEKATAFERYLKIGSGRSFAKRHL